MTRYNKKRKVERIRVGLPLRGRIGSMEVILLDLSFMGCRIEHSTALRVGSDVHLVVTWRDRTIDFPAHVVRCQLDTRSVHSDGTTHYQSGLLFSGELSVAAEGLRDVIVTQVIQALEQQKANAHGEIPFWLRPNWDPNSQSSDGASSLPYLKIARDRGYVCYLFEKSGWMKKRTRSAEQPQDGFTVWAYEDEEELERLTRIYEDGDPETRALIRICAELSLHPDDAMPPQRFEP
jgi:hypothetical protein